MHASIPLDAGPRVLGGACRVEALNAKDLPWFAASPGRSSEPCFRGPASGKLWWPRGPRRRKQARARRQVLPIHDPKSGP